MLGSVLVGGSASKIVEKSINLVFHTTLDLLVGWSLAFLGFVVTFIYWEKVEAAGESAAEKAQETVDGAKDAVDGGE